MLLIFAHNVSANKRVRLSEASEDCYAYVCKVSCILLLSIQLSSYIIHNVTREFISCGSII